MQGTSIQRLLVSATTCWTIKKEKEVLLNSFCNVFTPVPLANQFGIWPNQITTLFRGCRIDDSFLFQIRPFLDNRPSGFESILQFESKGKDTVVLIKTGMNKRLFISLICIFSSLILILAIISLYGEKKIKNPVSMFVASFRFILIVGLFPFLVARFRHMRILRKLKGIFERAESHVGF